MPHSPDHSPSGGLPKGSSSLGVDFHQPTLLGAAPNLLCARCKTAFGDKPFCSKDGSLAVTCFTLDQRYFVDRSIGRDKYGLRFSGNHRVLGKAVNVVLRCDLGDSDEFLRAARQCAVLDHENIAGIHDFGFDKELGAAYLVSETLAGRSLADELEAGPMGSDRALRIALQLTRALASAHAEGVCHGFLDAESVALTTRSGRADFVKLCHFGFAPLQARAETDIHALGALVFQLVAGREHEASKDGIDRLEARSTQVPDKALVGFLRMCVKGNEENAGASAPRASAQELEQFLSSALGSANPQLTGTLIGNYRIVGELGQGGVGTVYLAEHEVIGSKAALKVLAPELASNPELVERFIQEAKASSAIDSPAIPRYYDFGTLEDGRTYALMELVEGQGIDRRIAEVGKMPLPEVAEVAKQAASALARAHRAGIVHRDIKPEHLVVCPQDNGKVIKILDFGIAKIARPETKKTQVGMFMGTPAYCAPEQVLAETVSPRTDVYALGTCLFEMLCGQAPFHGSLGQVLAAKTNEEAPSLATLCPELPRQVVQDIAEMLARDPEKRIGSMEMVLQRVDAWPLERDELVVRDDDVFRPRAPSWRRPVQIGLAAAGVMILLALGFSLSSSSSSTDERVDPLGLGLGDKRDGEEQSGKASQKRDTVPPGENSLNREPGQAREEVPAEPKESAKTALESAAAETGDTGKQSRPRTKTSISNSSKKPAKKRKRRRSSPPAERSSDSSKPKTAPFIIADPFATGAARP